MFDAIIDFLKVKTEIFNGFSLPNWAIAVVIAALWIILVVVIVVAAVNGKKKKAAKAAPAEDNAAEPSVTNPEEEPIESEATDEESEKEPAAEEKPAAENDVEEKPEETAEETAEVTAEESEELPAEEEKPKEPAEEIAEEVAPADAPAEQNEETAPVEEPANDVAPVEEDKPVEEAPVEEAAPTEKAEEPAEETAAEPKPSEQGEAETVAATTKKAPAKPRATKTKTAPAKEPENTIDKEEATMGERRKDRYAGKGSGNGVFGGGIVEETNVYKKPAKKEEEKPSIVKRPAQTKAAPATKPAEKKTAAAKAPEKKAPAAKKEAPAAKSGATGKFEICNSIGGFRYLLSANNGQLLYESRDYKTFDSCKEAIDKFVAAVNAGDFRVRSDKFGNYKFNLKSNTSNNIVYVGESYSTKKACENVVGSVQRFAPTAKIVDITEADYVAPASAFDIPADVKKEVAAGKGATGKWEIALSEPDAAGSPYVFLLYANNGQLLYESRDYKTADNCKSGLDTFVKTLKDGNFIIDSDKFGRYKFILRKPGNQVEYVGQNYSDKAACTRSAVSVYKFGLLTPVE